MPTRLTLGHVYRPICPQSSGDQASGEVSAIFVLGNGSSLGHSVSKHVQKPADFFEIEILLEKWSRTGCEACFCWVTECRLKGWRCLPVVYRFRTQRLYSLLQEKYENVSNVLKFENFFKTMQRHSSTGPIYHSSICKKSRHLGLYMSISTTVFKTAVLNAFRASSPIPFSPHAWRHLSNHYQTTSRCFGAPHTLPCFGACSGRVWKGLFVGNIFFKYLGTVFGA